MIIKKIFTFHAAHCLPRVPAGHTCGRMHGHTYRVVVEISGPVRADGFVLDFAEISEAWKPLHERLDHACLNDVLENPTAENLAVFIADNLTSQLSGCGIDVCAVEVWETDTAGVRHYEIY